MAWHLFGTKPLTEPMLIYYQLEIYHQLDPKEHVLMKFHLKFASFHSKKYIWKFCL